MQKRILNLNTLQRDIFEIRVNTAGLFLHFKGQKVTSMTYTDVFNLIADLNKIRVDLTIRDKNEATEIYSDVPLGLLIEMGMFQNARTDVNFNPATQSNVDFYVKSYLAFTPNGYIALDKERFLELRLTKNTSFTNPFASLNLEISTISAYKKANEAWDIRRQNMRNGELADISVSNTIAMSLNFNNVTVLRIRGNDGNEIELDKEVLQHISDFVSDDFYKINGEIFSPNQNAYIPTIGAYLAKCEMSADEYIYLIGTKSI